MAFNLYIGAGRGGAYPLPVELANPDVLVYRTTPIPTGRRVEVQVKVRNNGNTRSDPFRLHLYRRLSSGLLTPTYTTRSDGVQVEAVIGPVTLIGGGPGQNYYLTADLPSDPVELVAMIVFGLQVVQPVYEQRPMCGVRTI